MRVAAVQGCVGQLELLWRYIELRTQVVRNRIEVLQLEVTIAITERSGVPLLRRVESCTKVKVVQVRLHYALAIVVVDLTLIEKRMTDAKIEDARIALRLLVAFGLREIVGAMGIDKDVNHRMVYCGIIDVPGFAK